MRNGTAMTITFGRSRNAVRMNSAVLVSRRCSHHLRCTISGTTMLTRSVAPDAVRSSTYRTSGLSTDRYGDGTTSSGTPISHDSQSARIAAASPGLVSTYSARTSSEIAVAYTSAADVACVIRFTGTSTV